MVILVCTSGVAALVLHYGNEHEADRSSDGAESDASGSWHQSDHDFVAADEEDEDPDARLLPKTLGAAMGDLTNVIHTRFPLKKAPVVEQEEEDSEQPQ